MKRFRYEPSTWTEESDRCGDCNQVQYTSVDGYDIIDGATQIAFTRDHYAAEMIVDALNASVENGG